MKKLKMFLGISVWGNWVNLAAGNIDSYPYLLQSRTNQFNRVQFKVRSSSTQAYGCHITLEMIETKLSGITTNLL